MAQQVIDRTATTAADPPTVWALLADGATWPEWSPLGSFELIEPGDGVPEGLGAVRLFTTGRAQEPRARRRAHARGRSSPTCSRRACRCATTRAVVTLVPSDAGTVIRWRSTFHAKVPGTGWIYRRQLGAFIGRTVDGLAAAAARARLTEPG